MCIRDRVCGLHSMGCPPALPVAVAGERISAEMLAVFAHYDIRSIEVLRGDVKPCPTDSGREPNYKKMQRLGRCLFYTSRCV